ncbi:hypothetical protein BC938DRAFT_475338 [Jimgerdemannia flammicorona]|uniref:Transmembrane protein 198 n=1 Tax=Jimgerdemannia flammicorona TaxID=994334 RepID=A0A433QRN9_9FUNG|nr:hypothetical protein BC938DRAFT_475338 [Jimgerdemannia flammicorona]
MVSSTHVPTSMEIRKNLTALFFLLALLFALLLPTVSASPVGLEKRQGAANSTGTITVPDNDGYQLTVHLIVLGVVLIVTGLIYTFAGYRFFRVTMFLAGFYFFANLAWIILSNVEPTDGYGAFRDTVYLVVSLGIGLIGGLFFVCCYHIGIYFLAAIGGYVLGLWILSWSTGGVIHETWGRIILLVGLIIVCVALVIFFERFVIIVLTSVIGAWTVILGLDMFIHTGFAEEVQQFLNRNHQTETQITWKVQAMLAGVAALAIVGIIVQFKVHPRQERWSRTYARKKPEEQEAEQIIEAPAEPEKRKKWFWIF